MDIVLLVRIGIIVDGVVLLQSKIMNYDKREPVPRLCGRRVDDGIMTALCVMNSNSVKNDDVEMTLSEFSTKEFIWKLLEDLCRRHPSDNC